MSIVLNGYQEEIPGLVTVSYLDEGTYVRKPEKHLQARVSWIRSIFLHTIHGKLGNVLPGLGPNTTIDERLAKYQATTQNNVSWDYTIDFNGDVTVHNDPKTKLSWQAGQVNPFSLGIEIIQKENGDVYEEQLNSVVLFLDFLTAKLGIQRQVAVGPDKKPFLKLINRFTSSSNSGKKEIGIFAHCNATTNRGSGDPGIHIFQKLLEAGYEQFNFGNAEDIVVWKARQKTLVGMPEETCDGVPGPLTVAAIKSRGISKHGIWVARPIDQKI